MSMMLKPCPFCEGPPCVSAFDDITRAKVDVSHQQLENEHFIAYVWCHDCGSQGPIQCSASLEIFDQLNLTVEQLITRAAAEWNDRHAKARHLYDANVANGLCRQQQGVAV